MALTKERKVLIAVAGAACLVFVGDRLMGGGLTGPKDAAAAATSLSAAPGIGTTQAVSATAAPAPAPLDADVVARRPSLAQRLDAVKRLLPAQTPDPFTPGPRWLPEEPQPTVPTITPSGFDQRAFVTRHRLEAVYVAENEARAVVGGRVMRVGDALEGMTLTAIGERWVEWRGHDTTLRVPLHPSR